MNSIPLSELLANLPQVGLWTVPKEEQPAIGDMVTCFHQEWCVTELDGPVFWAMDLNGEEEEFTVDQIDHLKKAGD
jgi:hypothetical protein